MSTSGGRPVERVRALRGATSVEADDPAAIEAATGQLLRELFDRNGVASGDLISMIFTATPDLSSAFPAAAARGLGLEDVPLLCSVEIEVPGSIPRCIRVLVHLTTAREPEELQHVYLERARSLRTDLDV